MTEAIDNWVDDKLERKACATFLTNYLTKRFSLAEAKKKPDTLVLNIRAKWGFGKTFFVDRWIKDLRISNYPVVHFDAWANDFSEDPLIGFIAAMDQSLSEHYKDIPVIKTLVDKTLGIGSKLIKPVSLGIAGVITKQLAGLSIKELMKFINEEESEDEAESKDESEGESKGEETHHENAVNEIKSVIASSAKAAIKEHQNKQQTIKIFKKRLGRLIEALTNESNVQLPLFVFIDELDRCRPLYAIELLEAIKHLFGVPGIYFVVSTNLEQLGHSIRAVYGEQFESEQYLKRFFDLEYHLPKPDRAHFTSFLFDEYSLDDFQQCFAVMDENLHKKITPLQVLFGAMIRSFDLGLRDEQQIARAFQAILISWQAEGKIHVVYLLFLIIARQISTSYFEQIGEDPSALISTRTVPGTPLATFMPKKVMIKVDFPSSDQSLNSNSRNDYSGEASTLELVREYLALVNVAPTNIGPVDPAQYGRFKGRIQSALIGNRSRNSNSKEVALSDYHRIVSQAGQLTSITDQ